MTLLSTSSETTSECLKPHPVRPSSSSLSTCAMYTALLTVEMGVYHIVQNPSRSCRIDFVVCGGSIWIVSYLY
ncbi:30S ribosomal protein S16, partial [Clarias magur]